MKKLLAGLLLVVLLMGVACAEKIDVTYNNIKVYVDGVLVDLEDAFGNDVEPFIYNGEVYLPLSAVADAVGMSYSWSGAEMSAYLGGQPGEVQYLLEVCPPYQKNGVKLYTREDGKSFSMAGKSFTNGFVFENTGSDKFLLFNLNGQYEKMTFTLGHVDGKGMEDVTFQIFLDGKLAGEYFVPAEGLPTEYTINLNHALSMKITGVSWIHYAGIAEVVIE